MNILFVTLRELNINSSVTISNMGLLKGLVESGCDIDLLTPGEFDAAGILELTEQETNRLSFTSIDKNRALISALKSRRSCLLKGMLHIIRPFYYRISLYGNTITLLNKADLNALNLTNKKYDYIISTSDPKTSHIFVKKLIAQGLKYEKWIQSWGDPMCIDISRNTIHPKRYVRKEEEAIIAEADRVIYVSPLTLNKQKEIYSEHREKMSFIPLPYFKIKKYGTQNNTKTTLGYFGDYNSKIRNIEPLYNFGIEYTNYALIIAGGSNVKLSQTDNIDIFPRRTHNEVEILEEKCDIIVCLCNKRGTQIPGKIYYYAATSKPILVILDGEQQEEIREFLSKYNRYQFCENNVESIKRAIVSIDIKTQATPCKAFSPVAVTKMMINQ